MNMQKEKVEDLKEITFTETVTVTANFNVNAEKSAVLSISGYAGDTNVTIDNNTANFSATVFFNLVFMGEEPMRLEKGVKLDFKKQQNNPIKWAECHYMASDFTVKKDDNGLIASCLLTKTITLCEINSKEVVVKADALMLTKTAKIPLMYLGGGVVEAEDKFEERRIKRVLCSRPSAAVLKVTCGQDVVTVEGNLAISFVFLPYQENSDIIKQIREVPFKFEFDLSGVDQNCRAKATCSVKSINVKVYYDEEENKSTVESLTELDFCIKGFSDTELQILTDAAKNQCELIFERQTQNYFIFNTQKYFSERVSGRAEIAIPEYSRFIKACENATVIKNVSYDNGELLIAGEIIADCLFMGDNGLIAAQSVLPFTLVYDSTAAKIDNVRVETFNISGRLRAGNLEQDATLYVSFCEYDKSSEEFVLNISEGKQKKQTQSLISIYIAAEGDSEWDVTKALGEDISVITKFNPGLDFPLKGKEKIIVLRKTR